MLAKKKLQVMAINTAWLNSLLLINRTILQMAFSQISIIPYFIIIRFHLMIICKLILNYIIDSVFHSLFIYKILFVGKQDVLTIIFFLYLIIYNYFKMSWINNVINSPKQDFSKIFSLARDTPNQIPQPSPFMGNNRLRFNSFNSSFMSPMRMIQSPAQNDSDFFEFQLKPVQKLQKFKLNDDEVEEMRIEDVKQKDEQDSEEDQSNEKELDLSYKNIILTIVNNLGINQNQIQKKRKQISLGKQPFLLPIYQALLKKFRKLKKTKEQMTKYCIRKVFRYLSEKIKKQSNELGLKDNEDCLTYYFTKFENDKNFTIPFKKNSVDKTMNSAFLAKIFSCPLFVEDYKKYLRLLKGQAEDDNNKKINALTKIIEKTVATKNIKKIQSFTRYPWTLVIITKTYDLANSFLQYAKQSNSQEQLTTLKEEIKQQTKFEKPNCPQIKKKSIILLTPPFGPLGSPNLEDKKLDQILKYYQ